MIFLVGVCWSSWSSVLMLCICVIHEHDNIY